MRSSAPEGQHAPRAKQTPPSGNSGATAGPAGAPPPPAATPHSIPPSSRPQPSVGLKSSAPLQRATASTTATAAATLTPQSRAAAPPRGGAAGLPQSLHRSTQRSTTTTSVQQQQIPQLQQRSPPTSVTGNPPPGVGTRGEKVLTPLPKGLQPRLTPAHHPKTSPQALAKSQPSFGGQQKHPHTPAAVVKPPGPFKGVSPNSKGTSAAPNPPNFGEYDDQEWDVGVGHLIIDLDADIAQADRGRMSGAPAPSGPHAHQGPPGVPAPSEDKHSLKMKIKRTKPPTKTSEAKHEIVKPDTSPQGPPGGVVVMVSGTPSGPQHNGATPVVKVEGPPGPPRVNPSASTPRTATYKKEKRRLDINGTAASPPPPTGVPVPSRSLLHSSPQGTPHSTTTVANQHPTITSTHPNPTLLPISTTSATQGTPISSVNAVPGSHHQTPDKGEPQSAPTNPSTPARLTQSALQTQPSPHPQLQHQKPQLQPQTQQLLQLNSSSQIHENSNSSQPQNDVSCPASKRQKLNDEGSKRDACVGTSVATITEPDCLGPCEPGSSVTLEGIVWHETEGGVLVVNVTWRGKTYVGTLLDCTKHDWAPPRFCDSPTSDLESRTPKGRAKRGRAAAAAASTTASVTAHTTPTSDLSVTETRSGKLRNASVKGRRGAPAPTFNPPASPVKVVELGGTKRKGRDVDLSPMPDPKMAKRARSATSRSTPTNGPSSPLAPEQPPSESQTPQPPSTFTEPPQPPTSPQLIECPEPNCSKKYKHINGLKYHQSHAHTNSEAATDEDAVAVTGGEENAADPEETRQPSPPSPTPLASTPADASSRDLIKPAVLRPITTAPSSHPTPSTPTNSERAPNVSQPIILHQTLNNASAIPNAVAASAAKSPQHLYVYPPSVAANGVQKPNANVGSSAVLMRQTPPQVGPQGSTPTTVNSNLPQPTEALPQLPTSTIQPKQETPSVPSHISSEHPTSISQQQHPVSQQQNGVVVLTPSNQVSASHPLINPQPKPLQLQQSSHPTTHPTLLQNHSQLPATQIQSSTSQHLQQLHPVQQQHQTIQIPQHFQQSSQQNLQHQPAPQQLHQQLQQQQHQMQLQQSLQHQSTQHQPIQPATQQPPQPQSTHPLQIHVSLSSQHTMAQQHQIHSLQQQKVQHVVSNQQQSMQHGGSPQSLQAQSGGSYIKPQLQPIQPQPNQKPQPQQPSQSAPQNIIQSHSSQPVYHSSLHDQTPPPLSSALIQSQSRGDVKPELMNRLPVHVTSPLPTSRSVTSLLDGNSTTPPVSTTVVLPTPVLPTSLPEGTSLSSLPGSLSSSLPSSLPGSILSSVPGSNNIKLKTASDGDKLLQKPKEMVNGLLKKDDEAANREDTRSPAYSDISDANDSAPVIDEPGDSKDFKDEKKPDIPLGAAPPYAYGLYFGGYGQPPHPYLMPPIQHPSPQGVPNAKHPGLGADLKDKTPDKDKKDYLPLPGSSDYMKFPPQYLYSYSHLYPPGYPDPYLREPLYKDMLEKPKLDHEECNSLEDGDKGPTDLSRNAHNNLIEKGILNLKEGKPPIPSPAPEVLSLKDQFDCRGPPTPLEKRPLDSALAYRYLSSYDGRLPLLGATLEKSVDPKAPPLGIPKADTPGPLHSSPRLGSTPPGNNKEDKNDKRGDLKSEGVKPTMETTGPPPPPNASAYYPPFPYAHVPFDPYRPPMVPGMSLTAGFPPYLAAPPPGLGGLRYQLGAPNGPEDLSPSGSGATILTPGLYTGSHKIAELQERTQKSPSGQVVGVSSTGLVMSRGGSPLTLIASNHLGGAPLPPHSLSHIVSSPSFSSSPMIFTSSIGAQQGAPLMSSGHFGDRKTPPIGPRIPSHPSLPEGYAYPLLPAQFSPHFTALGMSPTAMATVGVAPSGMGGAAPLHK